MKRFTKESLLAAAGNRLPGYVEAVLAAVSREDDTYIWLEDEVFADLRGRFAVPPPFLQKAKNFAKAAVSHVAAGMPLASDEEIERRFAICQTCPFLKDGSCVKCGCPVVREKKFISKLAWADQKCPVGHW